MTRPLFVEGDRVTLRVADDTEPALERGKNHPDVRRYVSVFRRPRRSDSTDSTDDDPWTVIVPRGADTPDDPVGSVSLAPIQQVDGYANLGVWLSPDAWGHGYAVDACAHMIDYGFRELALHRVSATAMTPNEPSIGMLDRLGFVHEGTAREAQFADGEHVDAERYGLLRGEWEGPEAVLDADSHPSGTGG